MNVLSCSSCTTAISPEVRSTNPLTTTEGSAKGISTTKNGRYYREVISEY